MLRWLVSCSLASTLLSVGACSQLPGPIEGSYSRAHDIHVNALDLGRTDTDDWQTLRVTDCLRVERRSDDELYFQVVLVQENLHSCSAEGIARRRGFSSEYEAELETIAGEKPPCRVGLRFSASGVSIDGWNLECNMYCGAAAVLEGRFVASSRRATVTVAQCFGRLISFGSHSSRILFSVNRSPSNGASPITCRSPFRVPSTTSGSYVPCA
jgi:hypothetical protein